MKLSISLFFFWLITIIISLVWSFENPEKIEKIKSYFKKNEKTNISKVETNTQNILANSFTVEIEQVLELKDKSAFAIHPQKKKFEI